MQQRPQRKRLRSYQLCGSNVSKVTQGTSWRKPARNSERVCWRTRCVHRQDDNLNHSDRHQI